MKRTIRLTENELKGLIKENVKKVLKEYQNYEDRPEEIGKLEDDNYYGGGLPEQKPQAHKYTCEKEITEIYNKVKPYINQLADIFNNNDFNNHDVYEKVMNALNTLDMLPSIGKEFYTTEIGEFNNNY